MTAKVGDIVRFLNSVGGGKVTRIDGQIAYVDDDGFETPALLRECVVVASGDTFYKIENKTKKSETKEVPAPSAPKPKPQLAPITETPEGEKLNIVLGFEAADLKRLSDTSFDAFLVNDSNFGLYMTVATRPNESNDWDLRFAGFIEPGTQEFLFELTPDMLPEIDRISVQALPFKRNAAFTRKPAIDFEQRFDSTKFARLHCFTSNPYFDSKVIALSVVENDKICNSKPIDIESLKQSFAEKEREDRRRSRPVSKVSKSSKPNLDLLEVDLHAGALLDNLNGLSKADILNYQIDPFRKIMDENLKNIGKKIVFIHGKGEGVLRSALMKELNHRYKGHDVADASFREYGFGATQVTIKNLTKK